MDREGSGRVNWESGFSLQLLVQQSFLPAQHIYGYTAFLGQNWYHMKIPQVICISDINTGCPKGDRESIKWKWQKLPYQNLTRHVVLKHRLS